MLPFASALVFVCGCAALALAFLFCCIGPSIYIILRGGCRSTTCGCEVSKDKAADLLATQCAALTENSGYEGLRIMVVVAPHTAEAHGYWLSVYGPTQEDLA